MKGPNQTSGIHSPSALGTAQAHFPIVLWVALVGEMR